MTVRAAAGVVGLVLLIAASLNAQSNRTAATLRITVVDPSGAVIVGARVTVTPNAPSSVPLTLHTGDRGEATFTPLAEGHYVVRVDSAGFESYEATDVRVRAGDNRRRVKLAIARLAESVNVTRDARERASDPRGDAFTTVLGPDQINELPDDPDEMERMLKEMAGPGAVLRVNGFRGGKLPPKGRIQQIRFRRNLFAADAHEPGFIAVDIITRPGLDSWRGSTTTGFGDAALTARNAFAPVKGDERHQRYGFSFNGPLWRKHTSLALSIDGANGFDTKTIVAALPTGRIADSIRKPNGAINISARLEHALTTAQMLRVETQKNHTSADNLGVGDFDLAERGYSQTQSGDVVRVSLSGSVRRALFNELRFQWRSEETLTDPINVTPAVLVLNAFNAGGAQMSGSRAQGDIEIADDLDLAIGKHAIRAGFLLEGGRYRTDEFRNAGGTFTFASLDDFGASRPTTFTQNVGDPHVAISQFQAGLYVQDDIRARKDLTVSLGVRQEIQSHIGGVNIGPRGGIVWSPFRSGRTTVRAGGGVFFDWFDARSYQQAVQLDGTHQRIATIEAPGYPDATSGGFAPVLPSGRVQLASLTQPQLREGVVGLEQQLPGDVRVNAMYIRRRGKSQLRGVNANVPLIDGTRPDPTAGAVTEIQSTAASAFDALSINLNYMRPRQRVFIAAHYTLSRSTDETDNPFSLPADSHNLASERGPSVADARHRFMSLANVPLPKRVRLGASVRVQSALPYNITTGRDDNGDTVSNDRPSGLGRNSARGRAQIDLGGRLSWTIGFGQRSGGGPEGPQVRIVRGSDADPLRDMPGGGIENNRYGVELYAQAYNLLNHTNALNFSGVMTSPFFGQSTSATPPRRIELGARVSF